MHFNFDGLKSTVSQAYNSTREHASALCSKAAAGMQALGQAVSDGCKKSVETVKTELPVFAQSAQSAVKSPVHPSNQALEAYKRLQRHTHIWPVRLLRPLLQSCILFG